MMTISPQTLLPWVDAIGWTLLHFIWQGAVLGLVYRLARPLFGGVAARYRLGIGMLAAMAVSVLLTLACLWPDAAAPAGATRALPLQQVTAAAGDATLAAGSLEDWLPYLVALWFVGASLIGLRAFSHWRRLAWLVRHAAVPLPECAEVLARLARRFGIARRVRLLGSIGVDTPMLVGWLRPVILLPLSMMSGFTPQQIELIIAHELGHVRRWDYLVNVLQVIIETVLFYHPVVHWISREVRDARESCCDDLVLALAEGSPVVYASTLADLEQLRHDGGLAAPALAASGGVLLDRIRRIVGTQGALSDPLPRSGGWPIVLIVAGCALLAALRLHTPVPDLTRTLLQAPAASIAAISGNPQLSAPVVRIAAPAAALVAAPRPEPAVTAVPLQVAPLAAIHDETAPVASEPVTPVARPHITVALSLPPAAPRPRDISAPLAALPALAAASVAVADMPVVLRRVQPAYPRREKLRGITGNVELQFAIQSDGSVGDVSVLQSSPEKVFDRVAIAALLQWRFAAPATAGSRYTQNFAFALGAAPAAAENCHEVIGSHICRYMMADGEAPE
jgi:TonB family protein